MAAKAMLAAFRSGGVGGPPRNASHSAGAAWHDTPRWDSQWWWGEGWSDGSADRWRNDAEVPRTPPGSPPLAAKLKAFCDANAVASSDSDTEQESGPSPVSVASPDTAASGASGAAPVAVSAAGPADGNAPVAGSAAGPHAAYVDEHSTCDHFVDGRVDNQIGYGTNPVHSTLLSFH